jgi:hypothetical protein
MTEGRGARGIERSFPEVLANAIRGAFHHGMQKAVAHPLSQPIDSISVIRRPQKSAAQGGNCQADSADPQPIGESPIARRPGRMMGDGEGRWGCMFPS